MKNSFHKTILRHIINNPRRYLAIMFIVALGVSFFSGVRAASPNMRDAADKYLDDYNASDIQIISTLGFDDEDIQALRQAKNTDAIMPAYSVDGFVIKDGRTLLINFQSIDTEKISSQPKSVLNMPVLVEGRFPSEKNECVLDYLLVDFYNFKIGDTIQIQTSSDPDIVKSLNQLEYKIVGFVNSVQYISFQRGSSTKGDGSLTGFAFIPEGNFTLEVYTGVFIKAKNITESRFSEEYKNKINQFKEEIKQIGNIRNPQRYQQIKEDAEKELEKGRKELKDAENKLSSGEKEILEGEKKLNDGQKELEANRKKYQDEITKAKKELDAAKVKLEDSRKALDGNQKQLNAAKDELNRAKSEMEGKKAQLEQGEQAVSELYSQISALTLQLEHLSPGSSEAIEIESQISQLKNLYNQMSRELEESRKLFEQGMAQIEENEKKLSQNEIQLKKGWDEYNKGKAEYEKNLALYEKSKAEGATKLEEAERELNKSRRELEKAKKELNEKKPDALKEMENARKKLEEGERELEKLKEPEWYIIGLNENTGVCGYRQDTDRVAAIGLVFPLIFFLVAALVCLTNMTRIVEDDRTNIGILKALGYSGFKIASKYLVYSCSAAGFGIALGVLTGSAIFPRVIADAYGIIYALPPVAGEIDVNSSCIAGIGAIICTVVPTLLVCYKELAAVPATLMRPRAPKSGRRIMLERLPVIWNRLNFSQKVTCRNLFRYKKRLLMTVLGIAGCTGLVYTGFGLKDSIRLMVPVQYEQIQKYDMTVFLRETGEENLSDLESVLSNNQNVKDFIHFHQTEVDATTDNSTLSAYLIVTDNTEKFNKFITLRKRRTHTPVRLSNSGVVITEKFGRMLGIKIGDTITLKVREKPEVKVKVEGITENYVMHYIYMTDELYQSLYGESPEINAVYSQIRDNSEQAEGELSKTLVKLDYVASVSFNTTLRQNFDDMVSAMDYVVLVLILSAATLAFIVLFSLTSINIDERRRELATLKVLGFYDVETNMYLYRESFLLTLIGIAVGSVLGVFMLSFVITTAEVDIVMFTRSTRWTNFLFSALMTIAFSAAANLLTSRTINRIDMVESLKSVE